MKLTKQKLREIIREEIQKLDEGKEMPEIKKGDEISLGFLVLTIKNLSSSKITFDVYDDLADETYKGKSKSIKDFMKNHYTPYSVEKIFRKKKLIWKTDKKRDNTNKWTN